MSLAFVESLLARLQRREHVINLGLAGRVAGRRIHSGGGTQIRRAVTVCEALPDLLRRRAFWGGGTAGGNQQKGRCHPD
jgi:hypothetical protein